MGTRNKETQRRSMRIQPQRCSTQSCLAKPDLNSCSALGLLKAPRQQMHQQNSLTESDLELQLTTLKLRSWIYSFFHYLISGNFVITLLTHFTIHTSSANIFRGYIACRSCTRYLINQK